MTITVHIVEVLDLSASLTLEQITKTYQQGESPVKVLNGVSLTMSGGESLSIMGPSGSGKSTLLHIIGTLDQPSGGSLRVDDQAPFDMDEGALARFRNEVIGFVFQDHHLLPQYTVMENVLLPTRAFPDSRDQQDRANRLLERVGLAHRLKHRPAQLSGGERQRVAIARALINEPTLLLCDEPTGNLDSETAAAVADLLLELHREEQNIMIVVTHSDILARRCVRATALSAGKLADQSV